MGRVTRSQSRKAAEALVTKKEEPVKAKVGKKATAKSKKEDSKKKEEDDDVLC